MMLVYTAVFGGYDEIAAPRCPDIANHEWRAVTDDVRLIPSPYRALSRDVASDPRRAAREAKINGIAPPHSEVVLWHGGNVQLTGRLTDLLPLLSQTDVAVLQHPQRRCAYDEAHAVIAWGLDDPATVEAQMARYESEGYPHERGLSALFLLLRRRTPQIAELERLWWSEVSNGSIRDQLSFDYCCWRLGITPAIIPGGLYTGPYHERNPYHKKEGKR